MAEKRPIVAPHSVWEKYVFSWGGCGILILSSEKSVGPPLRFNEKNS